jgi:hypothetical protein
LAGPRPPSGSMLEFARGRISASPSGDCDALVVGVEG